MYCYKGTSITGERCVNPHRTQLIDALIEFCARVLGSPPSLSVYFTYRHTIFQRGLARATLPLLHKER